MHGLHLPEGMLESQKLPEPLVTPSTKAEEGRHDDNISQETGILLFVPQLIYISCKNHWLGAVLARCRYRSHFVHDCG